MVLCINRFALKVLAVCCAKRRALRTSAKHFPGKLSESFANRADVRAVTFYQPDDTNKRANFYAWLGQKPMFNIE